MLFEFPLTESLEAHEGRPLEPTLSPTSMQNLRQVLRKPPQLRLAVVGAGDGPDDATSLSTVRRPRHMHLMITKITAMLNA